MDKKHKAHAVGRRAFLRTLAGGTAALTLPLFTRCGGKSTERRLPNFIVIFTDDQGYSDLGTYGAQGFETPHLDRMAAEGIRFTDFHVAAPSCTPSRAALLTGCYPQRVSLPRVLFPEDKIGISSDELTIGELLQEKGYATAAFGKWHLGHHKEFLPVNHGFDEYFGLPYSNDMWPNHPEPDRYQFPDLPLVEQDKIIGHNPDQTQLTTWYTERAVQFIEKNQDSPFFIYLPHNMPHVPLFVSEKFKGRSKAGIYGDVIMEIDWSVGRILDTLKKHHIDEHTLVVFTSDNGPWLGYGAHGGSARGLREGKGTVFEGGVRMPCIMRWPGKIPAGKACDELATTMDFLPTFAALVDADLPADRPIDGKDIRSLIFNESGARSPYEVFYYYNGWQLQAIRSGKWKLHFPHAYHSLTGTPGRQGKPGGYERKTTELVLYDLDEDVQEQHDVAALYPDIVAKLSKLGDRARADLGDGLKQMHGSQVRACGRL